jgi:3-oxoadipate enol-lactonase
MPFVQVDGTRLFYEDTGPGSTGETVVFSHGLLWSTELFRAQIDALAGRYRVLAWDHRGQGRSDEDGRRSIGIELVTDDALALFDALDVGRAHFVGLSMGGFVGMRIGARWPERLRSLVLLNTAAGPEPRKNVPKYTVLNNVARTMGLGLVAGSVMPIMFGRTTMTSPERRSVRDTWRERLSGNRRSIWRAVNGVIEREGIEHLLPKIRVPTLIVAGAEDVATTPDKSEALHAGIPGSKLVVVPAAGHSSTVEAPEAVTRVIEAFLAEVPR